MTNSPDSSEINPYQPPHSLTVPAAVSMPPGKEWLVVDGVLVCHGDIDLSAVRVNPEEFVGLLPQKRLTLRAMSPGYRRLLELYRVCLGAASIFFWPGVVLPITSNLISQVGAVPYMLCLLLTPALLYSTIKWAFSIPVKITYQQNSEVESLLRRNRVRAIAMSIVSTIFILFVLRNWSEFFLPGPALRWLQSPQHYAGVLIAVLLLQLPRVIFPEPNAVRLPDGLISIFHLPKPVLNTLRNTAEAGDQV